MNAQEIIDYKKVADNAWHGEIKGELKKLFNSYIRLCETVGISVEEGRNLREKYLEGGLKGFSQRKIEYIFSGIVQITAGLIEEFGKMGMDPKEDEIRLASQVMGNWCELMSKSRAKKEALEYELVPYRQGFIVDLKKRGNLPEMIGFEYEDEGYYYDTNQHHLYQKEVIMRVKGRKLVDLVEIVSRETYFDTTENLVKTAEKVLRKR